MSFTAPAFLWALPLAAAPLLLHLLSRRQARRLPFSDLTFLRKIYARALPRTRLQQWLLVAARCLLILFMVLSYAGPVLQAQGEAGAAAGSEGLDLAVLVDLSYSMGYRQSGKTRLELALFELRGLLRGLKGSDRVCLIPFTDRVELQTRDLAWKTPAEALDGLARLQPSSRSTDYAPPLKAAGELLGRDRRRRRVLLLLGDGARHGARAALPALDPGIQWLGLEWAGASPNAYIASAGPSRDSAAQRPQLLVRAAGLEAAGFVELGAEGRRLQGAALKGAGEQNALLTLPAPRPGAPLAWSGQASLRADALSADDSYFYSFRHPSRPRLLCLYGNPGFFKAPSAGYFFKELFGGAKESLLPYDAEYLDLSRIAEAKLGDYKLIILADFKDVPAAAAAELDRFVRGGGGLWVIPGTQTRPESLDALAPALPVQLAATVSNEGPGVTLGPAADAKAWRGFDLSKVSVDRYFLMQSKRGSRVFFKSSSGYPLLTQGARGEGRAAVWASPLDVSWSNLALKPPFAPWVQAVLESLSPEADRRSENRDLKVGQPLRRTWEPQEPAPANVRVRAPDGRAATLWLRERAVEYAATDAPGLYAFSEEGTGRQTVYAVNLDRASGESDLTPLSSPPWTPVRAENLGADFKLKVYGRDARGPALAAAVSFLIVEMLLALPRQAAAGVLLGFLLCGPAAAQHGDRFVWTQLKLGAETDPYPSVHSEILGMFGTVTSVLTFPERRVISLKDKSLFFSPLVVLAARQAPAPLDEEDLRNLRNYLAAGGVLWIEDASGTSESSFDRWVRRTLPLVLPESDLSPLPADHVLYKTFFLLRSPAGRVMVRGSLEGVSWAGRTAVVYSRNDLLGLWLKDALGKPIYPCVPGGEAQRHNGRKLAVNILMYALTGSYKADAVHQPFLLQKMRSGTP